MADETKVVESIAQMRKRAEAMRSDKAVDFDALMAFLSEIKARETVEANAAAKAKREAAKAEFEAKMAAIAGPIDQCKGAILAAIKTVEDALVKAGVDSLTCKAVKLGTAERTITLTPSGPGVPSSAPKAGTGGGRGGRVHYTKDGRSLSRGELVTELTGDANPNVNGLSVKADRLAAEHGWAREQTTA